MSLTRTTGRLWANARIVVAAIVLVTLLVFLAGDRGGGRADGNATDGSRGPGESSEPAPTGPVEPPPDSTETEEVQVRLQEVFDQLADGLAEDAIGDRDEEDWERLAADVYLGSLRAQTQEFQTMGWHQVGAARVIDVVVLEHDLDATPPTMRVQACVDSSDVQIVDADGVELRGEGTPTRSSFLLTLIYRDGAWLIAQESFAEDPDC